VPPGGRTRAVVEESVARSKKLAGISMKAMRLDDIPMIMIIGGGVLYHICQKKTPALLDPQIALSITFGLASLGCLALFLAKGRRFTPELHRVNWTSMALAAAILLIESGYLIGYRAGLKLNRIAFVCNSVVALVLLGIGSLFYGESFTVRTGAGMALCGAGLLLLLR
jgi:drug/metabolite transporter (DMT)-like permease